MTCIRASLRWRTQPPRRPHPHPCDHACVHAYTMSYATLVAAHAGVQANVACHTRGAFFFAASMRLVRRAGLVIASSWVGRGRTSRCGHVCKGKFQCFDRPQSMRERCFDRLVAQAISCFSAYAIANNIERCPTCRDYSVANPSGGQPQDAEGPCPAGTWEVPCPTQACTGRVTRRIFMSLIASHPIPPTTVPLPLPLGQ